MPEPDGSGVGSPAAGEHPPRSFAKRVVDPVNSFTWFAMDALWMCKLAWPAYVFAAATVGTGIWLLVAGWRQGRGLLLADLGLNCWIAMNAVWLVADLNGQPELFSQPVRVVVHDMPLAFKDKRHGQYPRSALETGGRRGLCPSL